MNRPITAAKVRRGLPEERSAQSRRETDLYLLVDTNRIASYKSHVIDVRQTIAFKQWLARLADRRAVEKIAQRVVRLQAGLFGDVKPVGSGVSEIRINHGPGYRVYFIKRGAAVILLLCGGDKSSQGRDIKAAKAMAAELEGEP